MCNFSQRFISIQFYSTPLKDLKFKIVWLLRGVLNRIDMESLK